MKPYIKFPVPGKIKPHDMLPWRVADLCKAYNFPTGLQGGGVIGILELGGGWSQHDLDTFAQLNSLPKFTVQDIAVNGAAREAFGSDPNADGEVALDIQVAAAAYHYCTGHMPTIKVLWGGQATKFQDIIAEAVMRSCDVLSISWGADEANWSRADANAVEQEAITATGQGLTIFAAAGDNSSDDGAASANVDLPAGCPHIVACGGTSKTRSAETVWGDGSPTGNGTGGGYSQIFSSQIWQLNAPRIERGRMVPDVAANADPDTGYLVVVNGQQQQIGGTSAVAPLYAGLFAALGKKLGFVTPRLWSHPQAFADIIHGSNGGYQARIGPDACTGLGVPHAIAPAIVA